VGVPKSLKPVKLCAPENGKKGKEPESSGHIKTVLVGTMLYQIGVHGTRRKGGKKLFLVLWSFASLLEKNRITKKQLKGNNQQNKKGKSPEGIHL